MAGHAQRAGRLAAMSHRSFAQSLHNDSLPSLRRLACLTRHLRASATSAAAIPTGMDSFKAFVVEVDKAGALLSSGVRQLSSLAEMPCPDAAADVTVRVRFSSLNYKDGMIVQGQKGVVTPPGRFPIVPGIDAAGEVVDGAWTGSSARVVITGQKIGQHFDGGYSQLLRVKRSWLSELPAAFSMEESMVIGTAGVTAMQCILHLEDAGGLSPQRSGEVLVTGAGGGVGSFAVALLAARGYNVVASSRRAEALESHLRELGATRVTGGLTSDPKRPLGAQLWGGVVDTVGGETLAAAVTQTKYRCAVATVGVAGSSGLKTTVYPFILRGVRLLGVDSTLPVEVAGFPDDAASEAEYREERRRIWARLTSDLSKEKLKLIHEVTIGLADLPEWSAKIQAGQVRGRVVVDVDK
mmetsp:Transcript_37918/g.69100  ORF Transcript_37918/g.69100 Transcript_37918/m.69100 type:complete len:410 (+) Transcript_37918:37-1266(+)